MIARQLVKSLPIWQNKHTINTCIAAYYHWTNTHKHVPSIVVNKIYHPRTIKKENIIYEMKKVKKHLVKYGVFSSSLVIMITKRQVCKS